MSIFARFGRYFFGHPRGSSSKVSLDKYISSSSYSSGSDSSFYSMTATTGAGTLFFFIALLGGALRAYAAGLAI